MTDEQDESARTERLELDWEHIQTIEDVITAPQPLRFAGYEAVARLGVRGALELWLVARREGQGPGGAILKRIVPGHAEERRVRALLRDEARLASTLHHPGLVALLDVGELEGLTFLVYELVDGAPLSEAWALFGEPPLGPRAIVDLGRQIAEALAWAADGRAHGAGYDLMHGHLCPANVLVERSGAVRIADLGSGAPITPRDIAHAQQAPEQLRGQAVDGRADVFALGAILAEQVMGRPPFPEGVLLDEDPRRTIRDGVAGAPSELARWIERMASLHPAERPTAREVARAFEILFHELRGESLAERLRHAADPASAVPVPVEPERPAGIELSAAAVPEAPLGETSFPTTASFMLDLLPDDAIIPLTEVVDEPPDPLGAADARATGLRLTESEHDEATLPRPPAGRPAKAPAGAAIHERHTEPEAPARNLEHLRPLRVFRLRPEAVGLLAHNRAFLRALGVPPDQAGRTQDLRWEYHLLTGGGAGPRVVQRDLESPRPDLEQVVVFLEGSRLWARSQVELTSHAQELPPNLVSARGVSTVLDPTPPDRNPRFLRFHERRVPRGQTRVKTTIGGKLRRFFAR